MWDCDHCGCQAIAGTIEFCPQCFTPREQQEVAQDSSEAESAEEEASDTPADESAEARSASVSPPADDTPTGASPEAGSPGTDSLRAAPKPGPPPSRGGSGAASASKDWGKPLCPESPPPDTATPTPSRSPRSSTPRARSGFRTRSTTSLTSSNTRHFREVRHHLVPAPRHPKASQSRVAQQPRKRSR